MVETINANKNVLAGRVMKKNLIMAVTKNISSKILFFGTALTQNQQVDSQRPSLVREEAG